MSSTSYLLCPVFGLLTSFFLFGQSDNYSICGTESNSSDIQELGLEKVKCFQLFSFKAPTKVSQLQSYSLPACMHSSANWPSFDSKMNNELSTLTDQTHHVIAFEFELHKIKFNLNTKHIKFKLKHSMLAVSTEFTDKEKLWLWRWSNCSTSYY